VEKVNVITLRSDGLYWPVSDSHACYAWTQVELGHVQEIINACEHHTSVIHAGGNVGAYALKFHERFDQVYVCECDRINYQCLCANTLHVNNIWPLFVALGATCDTVGVHNNQPHNCGTPHVMGPGHTPQLTIDVLGMSHISLIHLDTEGYELPVLQGAVNTIKTHKPLIVVEWLNHGVRYGWQQSDLIGFLRNLGYTQMKPVGSDMMFKP
jgi:FkbM family methyltransferase